MSFQCSEDICDLSLTQIMQKTNNIQKLFNDGNIALFPQMKQQLSDLNKMINKMQEITYNMNNAYHICNNQYNQHFRKHNTFQPLQHAPAPLTPVKLTDNLNLCVSVVDSPSDIPNSPIYWIKNINQFGIRVGGTLLRGNVGNVYYKKHIQDNYDVRQTLICKYGNKCKSLFEKRKCKFYHDPVDLLQLLNCGLITKQTYKRQNTHRNFMNTSWMMTDMPTNKKNASMRHFGSRNTLRYEFDLMSIENGNHGIQNFKHQLMHDILVMAGMHEYNIKNEC